MKRKVLFCILLIQYFSNSFAQTFNSYPDFIFLRQQPNAKSEAMGRGQVANYGNPFDAVNNPASSAFNQNLSFEFTYLQPHFPSFPFMEENVNFRHYGVSCNLGIAGAFSINTLLVDNYKKINFIDYWPTGSDAASNPKTFMTMMNYSNLICDNFSVGVNIDYFKDEFWGDGLSCVLFDVGLLKNFIIPDYSLDQEVSVALSCSNIFNSKVEQGYFKEYLPSILKAGVSYNIKLNTYYHKFRIFEILVALEYRDLLNSNYYTAGQFGNELTLLEILKLRSGYYSEKLNPYNNNSEKNNVHEFTYGAGLYFEMSKIFGKNIPFNLMLDFTRLPVPEYRTKSMSSKMTYSIYSISLRVKI